MGSGFCFVNEEGALIGLPYAYRDPQTIGKKEEFFEKVMPADELYGKTGNPAHGFQQYFPVVHVETTEGLRTDARQSSAPLCRMRFLTC